MFPIWNKRKFFPFQDVERAKSWSAEFGVLEDPNTFWDDGKSFEKQSKELSSRCWWQDKFKIRLLLKLIELKRFCSVLSFPNKFLYPNRGLLLSKRCPKRPKLLSFSTILHNFRTVPFPTAINSNFAMPRTIKHSKKPVGVSISLSHTKISNFHAKAPESEKGKIAQ